MALEGLKVDHKNIFVDILDFNGISIQFIRI